MLEDAFSLFPDNAWFAVRLCLAYLEDGRPLQALERAELFIERRRFAGAFDENMLQIRVEANLRLGEKGDKKRFREAVRCARELLRLFPNDPYAPQVIARYGRLEDAPAAPPPAGRF
jgi:hypothetical protein